MPHDPLHEEEETQEVPVPEPVPEPTAQQRIRQQQQAALRKQAQPVAPQLSPEQRVEQQKEIDRNNLTPAERIGQRQDADVSTGLMVPMRLTGGGRRSSSLMPTGELLMLGAQLWQSVREPRRQQERRDEANDYFATLGLNTRGQQLRRIAQIATARDLPDKTVAESFSEIGLEQVPVISSGVMAKNAMELWVAAERVSRGVETTSERRMMMEFLLETQRDSGILGKFITVSADMPAYMTDFALSLGVVGIGKGVTKAVAMRTIRQIVKKGVLKSIDKRALAFAAKTSGRVLATSALQTAIVPGRVVAASLRDAMPQLSKDESGLLALEFKRGDDDLASALVNHLGHGFVDQYIEIFSEHTGGLISHLPPLVALRAGIFRRWLKPPRTTRQFLAKASSATGYNGIIGEMFEEQVGSVLRGQGLITDAETLIAMGMAFAIPAGIGVGVEYQATVSRGKRVRKRVAKNLIKQIGEMRIAVDVDTKGLTAPEIIEAYRDALLERGAPYNNDEQEIVDWLAPDAEKAPGERTSTTPLGRLPDSELGRLETGLAESLEDNTSPQTRDALTANERRAANLTLLQVEQERDRRRRVEAGEAPAEEEAVPRSRRLLFSLGAIGRAEAEGETTTEEDTPLRFESPEFAQQALGVAADADPTLAADLAELERLNRGVSGLLQAGENAAAEELDAEIEQRADALKARIRALDPSAFAEEGAGDIIGASPVEVALAAAAGGADAATIRTNLAAANEAGALGALGALGVTEADIDEMSDEELVAFMQDIVQHQQALQRQVRANPAVAKADAEIEADSLRPGAAGALARSTQLRRQHLDGYDAELVEAAPGGFRARLVAAASDAGVRVAFFRETAAGRTSNEHGDIDGYFDPQSQIILLNADLSNSNLLQTIFTHEFTHLLRYTTPAAWDKLFARIKIMDPEGLDQAGRHYYTRVAGTADYDEAKYQAWINSETGENESVARYVEQNWGSMLFDQVMANDNRLLDFFLDLWDKLLRGLGIIRTRTVDGHEFIEADMAGRKVIAMRDAARAWKDFRKEGGKTAPNQTPPTYGLRDLVEPDQLVFVEPGIPGGRAGRVPLPADANGEIAVSYKIGDETVGNLRLHGPDVLELFLPSNLRIRGMDGKMRRPGEFVNVGSIHTDNRWQQMGIAQAMYNEALQIAQSQGWAGILSLHSHRSDFADRFWNSSSQGEKVFTSPVDVGTRAAGEMDWVNIMYEPFEIALPKEAENRLEGGVRRIIRNGVLGDQGAARVWAIDGYYGVSDIADEPGKIRIQSFDTTAVNDTRLTEATVANITEAEDVVLIALGFEPASVQKSSARLSILNDIATDLRHKVIKPRPEFERVAQTGDFSLRDAVVQQAVDQQGLTENYRLAAYVLPDGELLRAYRRATFLPKLDSIHKRERQVEIITNVGFTRAPISTLDDGETLSSADIPAFLRATGMVGIRSDEERKVVEVDIAATINTEQGAKLVSLFAQTHRDYMWQITWHHRPDAARAPGGFTVQTLLPDTEMNLGNFLEILVLGEQRHRLKPPLPPTFSLRGLLPGFRPREQIHHPQVIAARVIPGDRFRAPKKGDQVVEVLARRGSDITVTEPGGEVGHKSNIFNLGDAIKKGLLIRDVPTVRDLIHDVLREGGVTVDLETGNRPRTGFIVATLEAEKTVALKDFTEETVDAYLEEHAELLKREGARFGVWVLADRGVAVMDVSFVFKAKQEATDYGKEQLQESGWDAAAGESWEILGETGAAEARRERALAALRSEEDLSGRDREGRPGPGEEDVGQHALRDRHFPTPLKKSEVKKLERTFQDQRVGSPHVRIALGRIEVPITKTGKRRGKPPKKGKDVRQHTPRILDGAVAFDALAKREGRTFRRSAPRAPLVIEGAPRRRLIRMIKEDIQAASGMFYQGVGWYDKEIELMIAHLSRFFPELAVSDPHAMVFKFINAALSPDNTVNVNIRAARRLYAKWRKAATLDEDGLPELGTGTFDTMNDSPQSLEEGASKEDRETTRPMSEVGLANVPKSSSGTPMFPPIEQHEVGKYLWSKSGWTVRDAIIILNTGLENLTPEEFFTYMMAPTTVGKLRKDPYVGEFMKNAVSSESADLVVTPGMMLGPKVGAFFLNQMGYHDILTMDVWFARWWNTLTGSLRMTAEEQEAKRGEAWKKIKRLTPEQFETEAHGFDFGEVKKSREKALEWGLVAENQIDKRSGRTEHKAVRFAAKGVKMTEEGVIASPRGPGERTFIRDLVAQAQRELKNEGKVDPDMTTDDVQAVLWYFAQWFWVSYGMSKGKTTSESYGDVAKRIVQEDLGAARRDRRAPTVDDARASGVRPDRRRAARLRRRRFSDELTRRLRTTTAVSRLRGIDPGSRGFDKALNRELDDLALVHGNRRRGATAHPLRNGTAGVGGSVTQFPPGTPPLPVAPGAEGQHAIRARGRGRGDDLGITQIMEQLQAAGFSQSESENSAEQILLFAATQKGGRRRTSRIVRAVVNGTTKRNREATHAVLTRLSQGPAPLVDEPEVSTRPDRPSEADGRSMTRTESQLLRDKLRSQATGARAGAEEGQREAVTRAQDVLEKTFGKRDPATISLQEIAAMERARAAQTPEQITNAAMAMIQARLPILVRSAQEAAKTQAINIRMVKGQIRGIVSSSGLPKDLQAKFLRDVESAENVTAVWLAAAKIQILRAQHAHTVAGKKLLAAEKKLGKLKKSTQELRDEAGQIIETTRPLAFSKGNRRRSYGSSSDTGRMKQVVAAYDQATHTISQATNDVLDMIQARKDEVAEVAANRVMTVEGQIDEIQLNLADTKRIKNRSKRLQDYDRRLLAPGRMIRHWYDVDNLTRSAENRWDGGGVLWNLLHRRMKDAEESYNVDMRDESLFLDVLVREAGFRNLADALAKTMGTLGESNIETMDVTLGGSVVRISLDQGLEFLALDAQSLAKIEAGAPIQFAEGLTLKPIKITLEEIEGIHQVLEEQYGTLVQAMKARIETSIRPRSFAVKTELTGRSPVIVPGYWPTSRNVQASPDVGLAEAFRGNEARTRMLENAGFFEERTRDTVSPIVIKGLVRQYTAHIDHSLKIIHIAVPMRSALAVIMNPRFQTLMMETHGNSMNTYLQAHLLEASLVNREATGDADRIASMLNSRMVGTYLTTNIGTYLRQIGGLYKLMGHMPPKYFKIGVQRMRPGTYNEMLAHSGFISNRYSGDSPGRFSPVKGQGVEALDDAGFRMSVGALVRSTTKKDIKGIGMSWDRVLRTIKLLDWFDAINARVAWVGYQQMVEDEHPEWTPDQKMRWVALNTAEAMRSTQNTSSPLDAAGMAMRSRSNWMRYPLLFSSDSLKSANQLIRAAHENDPRKAARMAIGVLLNFTHSAFVTTGTVWFGIELLGMGIRAMMGSGPEGDDQKEARKYALIEKTLWRFMRDVGGMFPLVGDGVVSAVQARVQGWGDEGVLDIPIMDAVNDAVEPAIEMVPEAVEAVVKGDWMAFVLAIADGLWESGWNSSVLLGNPLMQPLYKLNHLWQIIDDEPELRKNTPLADFILGREQVGSGAGSSSGPPPGF